MQDERQGSPLPGSAAGNRNQRPHGGVRFDGRLLLQRPGGGAGAVPPGGCGVQAQFSAEKNRQFPGDISAKLRPLGLNYYVTCPGSPLEAERSAKSRLKQWALSTRCYPQDFEARLTRMRKKPRILFLTRLWDPEEPAVQQYPDLQAEWRQVNADRIELLHRLQAAFPEQFTGGVSDNACARRLCPELIVPDKLTGKRAYLHRMQHTEICVASTGLHGSTGWKLAEYVAAGRAIVTEPLRYTLPGGFEEGKTIKYIRPRQSVRSSCGSCWQTRRRS